MTYELAKELKEAGFPQTGEHLDYDRCPYMIYPNDIDDGVSKNGCYVPLLEELIEACGYNFGALIYRFQDQNIGWIYECIKGNIKTQGVTPEEAVVNLWLKLNESKRDTTTRKD